MSRKGNQISVLIAGATGSTGRELVSLLVSHPDVSRVVALARHPIPVNRWGMTFPRLHTSDALRSLSVVPVDWQKIALDASFIPISYVAHGTWLRQDEMMEKKGLLSRLVSGRSTFSREEKKKHTQDRAYERTKKKWLQTTGTGDPLPTGYVKYAPKRKEMPITKSSPKTAQEDSSMISTDSLNSTEDLAFEEESRAFLNEMLRTSFYRSVFSGHHVAINCLGTSHILSSQEVGTVNYELSIAFAKVVRLFNCMSHAEKMEEEEKLLLETISKELDSVLWGEIHSACYGKVTQEAHAPTEKKHSISEQNRKNRRQRQQQQQQQQLTRGGEATLRHYTQVSVSGASEFSPFPYYRAHGQCDAELLRMFNRSQGGEANPDKLAFNLAYANGFSTGSELPSYSRASGTADFVTTSPPSDASIDSATKSCHQSEAGETNNDEYSRKRAEILLRRDVIKIWDNSHLTIWRPGLLDRHNKRWGEIILGFFLASAVKVRYLAEIIVDSIVESLDDERAFGEQGQTNLISGKNISTRANAKELETQRDQNS